MIQMMEKKKTNIEALFNRFWSKPISFDCVKQIRAAQVQDIQKQHMSYYKAVTVTTRLILYQKFTVLYARNYRYWAKSFMYYVMAVPVNQ